MSDQQQLHFEDITDEPEDFQGEDDDNYDPRPLQDTSIPVIPRIEYKLNVETEVPGTDGNVFKTVIKEGTGNKYPPLGSQVTVHYTGRLGPGEDAEKFDSSRDRNQPFEFELGGGVVKSWNCVCQSMKLHERAILKSLPSYAYGEQGAGAKIPPNATLWFDIELLSWEKKSEDVSKNRDKSVMKTAILTPSTATGREHPDYESIVKFDIEVFKGEVDLEEESENKNAPVFAKKDWSFELGDFDVPQALIDGLCSLKKGEVSSFLVRGRQAHQAYAELYKLVNNGEEIKNESENVPVTFTMKLTATDFDVKRTWGYKNEAKIEEALKRKEQGNNYFKAKSLNKALKKYERAVSFVENDFGLESEELKTKANELKITILGNVAQCQLSLGNLGACVERCNKILEEQPENSKALFRKAKALTMQEEFDDAEKLLQQILTKEPANADVKNALNDVLAKKKAFNQKQKALYGKMFG